MTLEPTLRQRVQSDESPPGQLALVQYAGIGDPAAFAAWRQASERAARALGGQRTHDVRVDQVLAGGEMPYQALTVDLLPSGDALWTAFDAVHAERQAALSDLYALVARPAPRLPRLVKGLQFLAPLLRLLLGTTREKEMPRFAELANPDKGPVPETLARLRAHNQDQPFYMMNLNKYYAQARYPGAEEVSGERAYNRYGARIAPYLISVGGYPDLAARVERVLVGSSQSPLHDAWSELMMVYYPSRRDFLRMMSNSPIAGVHHRDAGLERAVLMPCSRRETHRRTNDG